MKIRTEQKKNQIKSYQENNLFKKKMYIICYLFENV